MGCPGREVEWPLFSRNDKDRRMEDPKGQFATTQWSLVLHAGKRGNRKAEDALAILCQRYWYPLYAYVRRRVEDVNEASDLTQAFFARLLEKNVVGSAVPERGRFRGFLLAALKNFLRNEWDRGKARKRGGGQVRFSLDLEAGESCLSLEPAHELTPECIYEKQWALTLLGVVMARLQAEFVTAGKLRQFEHLKGALMGDRIAYATAAVELGTSEEAARQIVHRMRKRYRQLLRDEIAQTVAEPNEVEDEIRNLFGAVGS